MGWWEDLCGVGQGVLDFLFKPGEAMSYIDGVPKNPVEMVQDAKDGVYDPPEYKGLDNVIKPILDPITNAVDDFYSSATKFLDGIFGWFGDIGAWLQANWWIIAIIGVLILLLYVKGGGVGAGGGGGTDDRDISVTVKPEFHFTDSLKKRMPKRRQSR